MTRVIGRTAGSNLGKPAVMAGVGILLISVLAGLADFGAVKGLVTGGDATTTAHDILASETTFRLAIAAFVVVAVLDVITDFHDIWTAGLVLFGSHLLLVGYLIYRSGFAPNLWGSWSRWPGRAISWTASARCCSPTTPSASAPSPSSVSSC
ncbi:MAG: hypothetical protein QOI16_1268 [Pseudonocardiales bacterium]|nr:hypothetical protein [Pseudonocardiales bacterium]